MSKHQIAKETRQRLEIMTSTTDGFVVAEADLKMRGPGDIEGTMQSGIALDLHIANLATDGQIIQLARDAADDVLNLDPELSSPTNYILKQQLEVLYNKTIDWSRIS
jgi:ATP-dependent DNA helicase RecG